MLIALPDAVVPITVNVFFLHSKCIYSFAFPVISKWITTISAPELIYFATNITLFVTVQKDISGQRFLHISRTLFLRAFYRSDLALLMHLSIVCCFFFSIKSLITFFRILSMLFSSLIIVSVSAQNSILLRKRSIMCLQFIFYLLTSALRTQTNIG